MKEVIWVGTSRKRLEAFPAVALEAASQELLRVQNGEMPTDFKPMPIVGPGVMEICMHRPHEYRVLYVAQFPEAIYVLHAFEKKTRKTRQQDIDLGEGTMQQPKRSVDKRTRSVKMYKSCGNIFKDVGYSDEDAAYLMVRGLLMIEVERTIKKTGWTQAKMAKALGVVQPRISELLSGRVDRFSVEILIKFLSRLGKEVEFKVKDKGKHVA